MKRSAAENAGDDARPTGKPRLFDATGAAEEAKEAEPTLASFWAPSRHFLYEQAVQENGREVEFLSTTFKAIRGRDALSFREDFCGTVGDQPFRCALSLAQQFASVGSAAHPPELPYDSSF